MMLLPDTANLDELILDDDLRAQLDRARGGPFADTLARSVAMIQADRNAFARLSPVERRRLEARKQLETEKFEDEDRHHIHSVLALCGLPYREPRADAREFVRECGRASLVVQAGYLKDPVTGKMVAQGVPYGPKARLLLLHICTMAMRQKSANIEIAESMSAFLRDLGFAVTGGERGTLRQFKEQLNRLAAARMQLGLWRGERSTTINTQPIKSFDIWLPTDPDQKVLWNSQLRLDQEFYETLREHAVPVDMRALRAFSHSAKQIDMVLWLRYRMYKLDRVYPISWSALQEQFGTGVASSRKFKQSFVEDMRQVLDVFPNLSVTIRDEGLLLKPSDPDRLFLPSKRTIVGSA